MQLGNIGKKDEYGKQRRIEHRGKYLRASRTGGVSLRAQAKAAGFSLTANSRHGVRISRTIAKNTQVAMQNGRFVLRGRYGKGATKMNLSKSGVSFSTRNRLGTFNWSRPLRSSAKIAGVQLRGRKAALLQLIYLLFAIVAAVVSFLVKFVVLIFHGLSALVCAVADYQKRREAAKVAAIRDERNARLEADAHAVCLESQFELWNREQSLAALILILCAWGRGAETNAMVDTLQEHIRQDKDLATLHVDKKVLVEVAHMLSEVRRAIAVEEPELILLSGVAARGQVVLGAQALPEIVLEIDELMLKDGQRSEAQEAMLEVMSDFGGLCFDASEAD
jgi:hypothetical protein